MGAGAGPHWGGRDVAHIYFTVISVRFSAACSSRNRTAFQAAGSARRRGGGVRRERPGPAESLFRQAIYFSRKLWYTVYGSDPGLDTYL